MGTLFTAIGKVLNIKFLLIFLSIIFYIDLYFHMIYQISFVENYQQYLNLKDILLIIIFYLVTLNIIVPLLAFILSWIGFLIRLVSYYIGNDKTDTFIDFLANNDLENLTIIEEKAIEDNNSALMKSYEYKLENYKELHSIYLFSFFISIELLYLIQLDSFSTQLVYRAFELLYFVEEGKKFFSFVFLGIPSLILVLFSFRYISSFKSKKISNWIGGIK